MCVCVCACARARVCVCARARACVSFLFFAAANKYIFKYIGLTSGRSNSTVQCVSDGKKPGHYLNRSTLVATEISVSVRVVCAVAAYDVFSRRS